MADDTPWARFYRQQAGQGQATVGRLLDSWKTRRALDQRDVAEAGSRSNGR